MSVTRVLIGVLALGLTGPVLAGPVGAPLPWQDHELPHVAKHHSVDIASRQHACAIRMGGTVDMDHALTREHATWHVGWQPNESLTIENIGAVPCENAKVIINDRGDWYTMESLLAEALRTARTEQEKVYLLWQFARSNRHHDDPLFGSVSADELHDPVKMLMAYGAGLCDDSGAIGSSMYYAAGFDNPPPFVRTLHGHVMCEVFAGGRWQFMDIDENVFYLDRENELPVGGDVVARDHDLAHREFHYGPVFGKWSTGYTAGALFGADDGRSTRLTSGHQIRVNLRPGERIEYRWDNIGKWAMARNGRGRRWVGNSHIVYEPSLADPNRGSTNARNVSSVSVDDRRSCRRRLAARWNAVCLGCEGWRAGIPELRGTAGYQLDDGSLAFSFAPPARFNAFFRSDPNRLIFRRKQTESD